MSSQSKLFVWALTLASFLLGPALLPSQADEAELAKITMYRGSDRPSDSRRGREERGRADVLFVDARRSRDPPANRGPSRKNIHLLRRNMCAKIRRCWCRSCWSKRAPIASSPTYWKARVSKPRQRPRGLFDHFIRPHSMISRRRPSIRSTNGRRLASSYIGPAYKH